MLRVYYLGFINAHNYIDIISWSFIKIISPPQRSNHLLMDKIKSRPLFHSMIHHNKDYCNNRLLQLPFHVNLKVCVNQKLQPTVFPESNGILNEKNRGRGLFFPLGIDWILKSRCQMYLFIYFDALICMDKLFPTRLVMC